MRVRWLVPRYHGSCHLVLLAMGKQGLVTLGLSDTASLLVVGREGRIGFQMKRGMSFSEVMTAPTDQTVRIDEA